MATLWILIVAPLLINPARNKDYWDYSLYQVETPAQIVKLKPIIDVHSPFFFMPESMHNELLTALAITIQPTASIQSIN